MQCCLLLKGFVATLKENFGFLETSEHDKEVFFHYRLVRNWSSVVLHPTNIVCLIVFLQSVTQAFY